MRYPDEIRFFAMRMGSKLLTGYISAALTAELAN
jgi:hypothetical protein